MHLGGYLFGALIWKCRKHVMIWQTEKYLSRLLREWTDEKEEINRERERERQFQHEH